MIYQKVENENEEKGLDTQELPFFDLIIDEIYQDKSIDEDEKEAVKSLTIEIVELLQDAINKPNFWKEKESQRKELQGKLDDILLFTEIEAISDKYEKLSVEIMSLAKIRHQELTGEI